MQREGETIERHSARHVQTCAVEGRPDMALSSGGAGGGGGTFNGLLGGRIIPGILHGGGVAGMDGYGHRRAFAAATFADAQRYHSGGVAGLRPDEVPAILQRGEVVLPKDASGTSASGGTTINTTVDVHVHGAPSQPRVEKTRQGRVDIYFEEAVATALTRPRAQKALGMAYGLRSRTQGG